MKDGKLVLHPEELVDRVVVPLKALALDLALEEPVEHPGGKTLGRRLTIERIFAQLRQVLPHPRSAFPLDAPAIRRSAGVMPSDAKLLDQA